LFFIVRFIALAQSDDQSVHSFGIDFLRKLGAVIVNQPYAQNI